MLSGFFEGVDELVRSWNLSVQDQVLTQKNKTTPCYIVSSIYVPLEALNSHSTASFSLLFIFFATFDHCLIIFDTTLGPIVPYVGGYSRGGVCVIFITHVCLLPQVCPIYLWKFSDEGCKC